MDTIGERIRWLRKQREMTLIELSACIGISNQSLSAIETGKNNPSNQTIMLLCQQFRVNELWLRTGVGEPFAKKPRSEVITEYVGQIADGNRSETEMLLIELMAETSVEEWKALAEFFRRLADKMNKPGTE